MALKAYGKIDFEVEVDRPSGARASHLEQMEKEISYFMPDNKAQWCSGQGNPTKSRPVNLNIKDVRKAEAHHLGVCSLM